MKMKLAFIAAVAAVISTSAVAGHHHHHADRSECTQVQEANGECQGATYRNHGGYNDEEHGGERDGDGVDPSVCTQVAEANGECVGDNHAQEHRRKHYTMIHRDGRTLPACGETGGSQADNGNTCWF